MEFTHLNDKGEAYMVNVGDKAVTARAATACATMRMRPATLDALQNGTLKKGDAIAAARIAGILAAKQTAALIPLCHPIPIDSVTIDITPQPPDCLRIVAFAHTTYKTGIEMEALTAASVAALTVYDMCKAIDRSMAIENIRLLEKSGGHSGLWAAKTV
ncbi:MAG: cyclic pyranopterin monophosphate synthase MoaC [Clostridiales bacterium]|jgi:cyclic pyranopterin phosphate synthase|nr:cyclic pyranopterin monophosphate synthase MoaC [Clostridiales bacterium]